MVVYRCRREYGRCAVGIYLNPDSSRFEEAVNSDIYIDKTGLLNYTNSVLHTMQKYICISRPRRFGKSLNMSMFQQFFPGVQNLMRQIRNY